MSGALLRYRVLAWVVGTALIVLVFVGIPLQIAGNDSVVRVAGAIHGFLYIVYLLLVLDLTRRTRLPLKHMVLTMAAGLVPVMTFVAERATTRRVREITRDAPSTG
jgi:integral membrane protein